MVWPSGASPRGCHGRESITQAQAHAHAPPDGSASTVAAPLARVPQRTRVLYGFGAVAYGIKDNGFSVFLLLFYNQVIGLDAGLVGLILLIALLIDAMFDPAVGHLSDRTRSRWGRRHPWLYASAIPIFVSWLFLWSPPEGSMEFHAAWLLGFAVLVRMSLSLNEVPSLALVPEMTPDYHERTAVLGWRFLWGWAGGLLMLAAAYGVFRIADPERATPEAFQSYAIVGALVMLVSVLVSAVGTHRRYARPQPAGHHQPTLRDMLACLKFRPFQLLLIGVLFAYTNQGVTFTLSSYLLGYVWRFGWEMQVIYAVCLFGGVLLSLPLARRAGYRYGKVGAAVRLAIAANVIGTAPYFLHYLGAFPAAGSLAATLIYLPVVAIATAAAIALIITAQSMMADVTSASFEQTGKQQEGVFYAGWFLMQKAVTGIGIFVSGQVLVWIAFPANARLATIDPEVVMSLAGAYAAITLVFGLLTAWAFSLFPLRPAVVPRA